MGLKDISSKMENHMKKSQMKCKLGRSKLPTETVGPCALRFRLK